MKKIHEQKKGKEKTRVDGGEYKYHNVWIQ